MRTFSVTVILVMLSLSMALGQNSDRIYRNFDLFYVDNSPLGFGGESLSEEQVVYLQREVTRKALLPYGHFLLFVSNADNYKYTFRKEAIISTLSLVYQQTEPPSEAADKLTMRSLIYNSGFKITDTLSFHYFSTGSLFESLTNPRWVNKLVCQFPSELMTVLSVNNSRTVPAKIFLYPPDDFNLTKSRAERIERKFEAYFNKERLYYKDKIQTGKTKEGVPFFLLSI